MFTAKERARVRERILAIAQADPRITAAALTSSTAAGAEDAWSDVDLFFGIAGEIEPQTVLCDWAEVLDREFGVLAHFDLPAGLAIYRVFLLPSGLEVDIGMTPQQQFGPRGPHFRLLFGVARPLEATPPPDAQHLIGLGWHHVLHARARIERGKLWQAEYWISALRDHTVSLACLRLGESPICGRGVDRLPATVTAPLAEALVRSLDPAELRRALAVATDCFLGELDAWDPAHCACLTPPLREFGSP